jgi:hypothetical protein
MVGHSGASSLDTQLAHPDSRVDGLRPALGRAALAPDAPAEFVRDRDDVLALDRFQGHSRGVLVLHGGRELHPQGGPEVRITARSRMLRSSRTLPGQA